MVQCFTLSRQTVSENACSGRYKRSVFCINGDSSWQWLQSMPVFNNWHGRLCLEWDFFFWPVSDYFVLWVKKVLLAHLHVLCVFSFLARKRSRYMYYDHCGVCIVDVRGSIVSLQKLRLCQWVDMRLQCCCLDWWQTSKPSKIPDTVYQCTKYMY